MKTEHRQGQPSSSSTESPRRTGLDFLRSVFTPLVYERVISPILDDINYEVAEFAGDGLAPSRFTIRMRGYWALFRACILLSLAAALDRLDSLMAFFFTSSQQVRPTGKAHPNHSGSTGLRLTPRASRALVVGILILVPTLVIQMAWIVKLNSSLAAPHSRVALIDLVPSEERFRSAEAPQASSLPEWVVDVVLILNLPIQESYPEYRVDIHTGPSPYGEPLWRLDNVQPTEIGNFTLQVPRNLLSGPHLIRLYGIHRTKTPVLLANYEINLP